MFASGKTSAASTGGYQISRSLRFNSADSAYLNRSLASNGNQQKFTFSYWFKRGAISTQQVAFGLNSGGNEIFTLAFLSGDTLRVFARNGGTDVLNLTTTAVYRDPSAWYHIVVAIDTTQATSSNRALMYVNGVQVTAFGTATYPAQNTNLVWNNSAYSHQIGREDTGNYLNGYLTETNFIDGQALTPSSFGETNAQTGVWQPKAYSGSYGTNGFYLNFSDNSNTTAATLGKDYSGNGNNWTPNNFSVTAGAGNDSLVDSPTSYGTDTGVGGTVRGNYCTLNPLDIGFNISLSNGNLDYSGGTADRTARATMGVSSGKWYWEFTPTTASPYLVIGVVDVSTSGNGIYVGQPSTSYGYYSFNGNKVNNATLTAYGATFGNNDVIGVALDMDAGTIAFYKNGTSQGTAFTGLTGIKVPATSNGVSSTMTAVFNFGQRPFAYTAPSGFKALCTQNLVTPTIGATTATQAGKFFNPVTYTGNGGTLSVTGVGFQPDFLWVKSRSAATSNILWDVNRGVGNYLASNLTDAAAAYPTGLQSFDANGFTLGSGSAVNDTSGSFVSWSWRANGTGVTNTAGSITSTVSANTTSGFSVVTWTGTGAASATIGHGLGTAPVMIIAKERNFSGNWFVYTATTGNTQYMQLNTTNAASVYTPMWNSTTPTSTVFSTAYMCSNSITYVAYCFAEVAGYSKFGSYTGNGSADGPFCFTGFKPAFVLIKSSTFAGSSWRLWDSKRNTYNVVNSALFPNLSNAEVSTADYAIDFVSNGFKIRSADGGENNNADTFIYAAFAETPLKFSLAR